VIDAGQCDGDVAAHRGAAGDDRPGAEVVDDALQSSVVCPMIGHI
jgi:hypothetical protein